MAFVSELTARSIVCHLLFKRKVLGRNYSALIYSGPYRTVCSITKADSISLFCWDFLPSNFAAATKLGLDLFLTGLGATTSNVGPRGRRQGWDSCSYTVVSFTARSDLVVLVITGGAEEGGGSSKAVLTAEIWFLLPLGLPRSLGASMGEGETEGGGSGGSVASLSFVFCLSLCLAFLLSCFRCSQSSSIDSIMFLFLTKLSSNFFLCSRR